MAVLTYKALHGGSPRYLSSLVHVTDVSGRPTLRSAGLNRLRIPPFKLSTIGGRAFPVAAAQLWTSLPDNVVTSANSLSAFRQQLKHTLFQQNSHSRHYHVTFLNGNTHSGLAVALLLKATLKKLLIDY